MSSPMLLEDQDRLTRRAAAQRVIAAISGGLVFVFAGLTFASAATAWVCIGVEVAALLGLVVMLLRLSRTRATLAAVRAELRTDL